MNATTSKSANSVAVTVVGALTILLGTTYLVSSCGLIFGGASLAAIPENDPVGGFGWFFRILGDLMVVVGALFAAPSIAVMLAGLGVLRRKSWGRIATFIPAVLASGLGVLIVGLSLQSGADDSTLTSVAVGAIHLAYGVFAIVVLSRNSEEFARFSS